LAIKYYCGLLFVHQFAVFVGKEAAVSTDLKLFDVMILLGGVDVATLHVVGEKDGFRTNLFEESAEDF
jgi:hypothetical protein